MLRRVVLLSACSAALLVAATCDPSETEAPARRGGGRDWDRPRLPELSIARGPERVSDAATYDTQPALALDAGGTPWLLWVAHSAGGEDRIVVARAEPDGWSPPAAVTPEPGKYVRPVLVRSGTGMLALWTRTGEETAVYAARRTGDGWSAPQRVSPPGHHLNPEACTAPDGRTWVVWQGHGETDYDLWIASFDGTDWSDARPLATGLAGTGNDWDPSIACDSSGRLHVVWTAFREADYDLHHLSIEDGRPSPARRLTGTETYDLHASVAVDARDRLWIAWDAIAIPGHGGSGDVLVEEGRILSAGSSIQARSRVRIACLEGGELSEPDAERPPNRFDHYFENSSYPKVAPDESGAIWLAYRAWSCKSGSPQTYWWDVAVTRYAGDSWAAVDYAPSSDGNLEEPAVAAAGAELWVAAEMEHRVTPVPDALHPDSGPTAYEYDHHWAKMPQGQSGDVFTSLWSGPATSESLALSPCAPPSTEPAPLASSPSMTRVQHEIEHEGVRYRVLFGDTHRHSTVSRCRAGRDATPTDEHRYAMDVYANDFHVLSDHSNHTSDFNWWSIRKTVDLFYLPGTFATLHGYEISNGYPTGHKNLVFPGAPTHFLRTGLDRAGSGPMIWESLDGAEAITIPHGSALAAGTDWEDHDPRHERLVEIYQPITGSSEHSGAPRVSPAARNEAGFVHAALEKGLRLGFIASTDHGFGAAYAVVLAREVTREAVYEALYARRCYGSTSYGVLLDFRVDGHLMGSEVTGDSAAEVTVTVAAPSPLARVVLFADCEVARTWEGDELGGAEAALSWTDPDPPLGTGDTRSFYVRVELENRELAWASPVWVTYP